MGGRTVQKYVETPLLTNHFRHQSHNNSVESASFKFDLRVWVLVTSFAPTRAYIYNRVYGRRCRAPYNYSASSITDTYTHLTNYSIQSKINPMRPLTVHEANKTYFDAESELFSMQQGGDHTVDNSEFTLFDTLMGEQNKGSEGKHDRAIGSAAHKLRTAVQSQRVRPKSAGTCRRSKGCERFATGCELDGNKIKQDYPFSSSDLLLTYEELLSELDGADSNRDGCTLWKSKIWPLIQRKVCALLRISSQKVKHRANSFEFLGFDVLLDERSEPWILEVIFYKR